MANIHTFVARNILNHIQEHKLEFGDKLPSERDLAAMFAVSRSSIREGIRSLIDKGILTSRRGDGTYVTIPEQATLETSLIGGIPCNAQFKDVFQLRHILEPQIAALAALNASQEQLNELKIIDFDMSSKALSGADITRYDILFHLSVAKCTGNDLLVRLMDSLGEILALARMEEVSIQERDSTSFRAHFKVIEAIAKGNPEAAKEAMREHIHFIEIEPKKHTAPHSSKNI